MSQAMSINRGESVIQIQSLCLKDIISIYESRESSSKMSRQQRSCDGQAQNVAWVGEYELREHWGYEIVLLALRMNIIVWQVLPSELVDGKAFPLAWN